MWKARPEDNRPALNPSTPYQPVQPAVAPTAAASPSPSVNLPARETAKPAAEARGDVGHIGKSVVLRGELTGNEDLYLDGEVEGIINLRDHKLVIGPNGKIKATITARDVVVHGKVDGNLNASERVELKRCCSLTGDVTTQRIVIEEGAFFKGAIDIKENHEREVRVEQRKAVASAATSLGNSSSAISSSTTLSAGPSAQGSFLEPK